MSSHKIEFQGKDVADAIKNACKSLKVSQEELDIEVVDTGSTGIFGLGRQKVRLRVSRKKGAGGAISSDTPFEAVIKEEGFEGDQESESLSKIFQEKTERLEEKLDTADQPRETEPPAKKKRPEKTIHQPRQERPPIEISPEDCDAIKTELLHILELMGLPSEVDIRQEDNSVVAHIQGDHVEAIIGQEGRVLDSLQYLLRKIASKRHGDRLIISLDAGDFRANRLRDLEVLAGKMAGEVRETGKTRTIPSLNPSERRIVHMVLQEEKDIRSRSVGEGLFKKVIIYLPGRGKKGGGSRRRKNTDKESSASE